MLQNSLGCQFASPVASSCLGQCGLKLDTSRRRKDEAITFLVRKSPNVIYNICPESGLLILTIYLKVSVIVVDKGTQHCNNKFKTLYKTTK